MFLKGVFVKYFFFSIFLMIVLQANSIKDIRTIKTDFTQKITNEENRTISYSGIFYAKTDGKALWIYKKPIKKYLYFLNSKVVIIEPNLEQVIFSKLDKFPKILNILKTAKKTKNGLIAKCCDNSYHIFTKNGKIQNIKYTDKTGNKVVINFFNQDINLILNNSIFRYKIPKDYDILQN